MERTYVGLRRVCAYAGIELFVFRCQEDPCPPSVFLICPLPLKNHPVQLTGIHHAACITSKTDENKLPPCRCVASPSGGRAFSAIGHNELAGCVREFH